MWDAEREGTPFRKGCACPLKSQGDLPDLRHVIYQMGAKKPPIPESVVRYSRQLLVKIRVLCGMGDHLPWGPESRAGIRLGGEEKVGSTEIPSGIGGGPYSPSLAVKVHSDSGPSLLQPRSSSGWGKSRGCAVPLPADGGALTLSLHIILQSCLWTKAFLSLLG